MTEASASICLILATALKSGLPPDSFHCHAIKNKSEAVQWKRPKTLNVVEDQDINNLTKSAYFSLARQTAENHNEKLFFFFNQNRFHCLVSSSTLYRYKTGRPHGFDFRICENRLVIERSNILKAYQIKFTLKIPRIF